MTRNQELLRNWVEDDSGPRGKEKGLFLKTVEDPRTAGTAGILIGPNPETLSATVFWLELSALVFLINRTSRRGEFERTAGKGVVTTTGTLWRSHENKGNSSRHTES